MPYLIDGYNLLYAMGLLHGRTASTALRKARLGLLGLLAAVYGDEASSVTVVFDAAYAPRGAAEEEEYRGLHVRFAIHEEQADDLIEALIRHESVPRRLIVVSDDHRIQQAARRRHCTVSGCGAFMDELERRRTRRRPKQTVAPPKPSSAEDKEYWLKEFADLENDPHLKELSDPREWEEIDREDPFTK
jgi:predicted RNA-binding protein with PIN domain